MRLNTLTLSGFRGAPIETSLDLDGKSCFMYAENGFGKTTFVDGLEYWSTGDVEAYHREGAQLDSLVNLDSTQAIVSCKPVGQNEVSRILRKRGRHDTEDSPDTALSTLVPIPILRHKTMADFMAKSAGEKKDILLDILGLGQLTKFRETLTTANNDAKGVATESEEVSRRESSALKSMCGEYSLIETAEALRVRAGLSEPVLSETQLEVLDITLAETNGSPNYTELITAIDRTKDLSGVNSAVDAWNLSIDDEAQSSASIINQLLTAGKSAITVWPNDSCPLCEQSVDQSELTSNISSRIEKLRNSVEARDGAQEGMTVAVGDIENYIEALTDLSKHPPKGGWQDSGSIAKAIIDLGREVKAVRLANSDSGRCGKFVGVAVPDTATLREVVENASTETDSIRALVTLASLRDQHIRKSTAMRRSDCAASIAKTFQSLLDLTTTRIQLEIEAAIANLSDLVSSYYSLLRTSNLYTEIKLSYTTNRSGGVEFHLEFDGRHSVSPPHRVMSESQLNSLGLALFLARLKRGEQTWNFFVLDDVVNSFDADHRLGLATLLQKEFSDWQVLLLTHDRYFQSLARDIFTNWNFATIGAWTALGGPVITQGSSLDLLITRIDDGRSSSELGGIARMALEECLSRPLAKLEMSIRYDPFSRFSARDLLDALRGGLKRAESVSLKNLDVLKRMSAESYMSNLGAHFRPADPLPTIQDLSRLASDLTELNNAFKCSSCETNVWKLSDRSQHSWQCSCGNLKC